MTTHIFPPQALARQKRYLRQNMRKPRDMTTREYVVCIRELNNYLTRFPPFGEAATQKHVDEFIIGNAWQKKMMEQGFDPVAHTLQELEEFCERQEVAEAMGPSHDNNHSDDKNNKHGKKRRSDSDTTNHESAKHADASDGMAHKKNKSNASSSKWCAYHKTADHDFSECKVMLGQAQKMRDA